MKIFLVILKLIYDKKLAKNKIFVMAKKIYFFSKNLLLLTFALVNPFENKCYKLSKLFMHEWQLILTIIGLHFVRSLNYNSLWLVWLYEEYRIRNYYI